MKLAPLAALVAAFFCVPSIAADPRFDSFMGKVVGNQTTISFGGGGTPVVTSSAHLGTPSVGNMGVVSHGGGVAFEGKVIAPLGATTRTVQATARLPISRTAFLVGLGAAASNPLVGIGLAIAAPALAEWLSSGGVRMNPNAGDYPSKPFEIKDDSVTSGILFKTQAGGYTPSAAKACTSYLHTFQQAQPSLNFSFIGFVGSNPVTACKYEGRHPDNGNVYSSPVHTLEYTTGSTTGLDWVPASMADILPYMDAPDSPLLTPSAVRQGVVAAGIDPFGAAAPAAVTVTGPATVPGQKTTTSETVKLIPGTTTIAAPGTTSPTQQGTKTTTQQGNEKLTYSGNTITNNTVNNTTVTITNNETNETTIEGDIIEETENKEEPKEIETCGLPGKPACKIDETGTPDPVEDKTKADTDALIKPLDDFLKDPKAALPELPTINWAFTLPSGCSPIALPAFDPWLQEIDVCQFQPMFHDIMGFVWVMGGIFGAIGIFWRNTFSQG